MALFSKVLLWLIGTGIGGYLLLCLALCLWQRRLMFFPSSVLPVTPATFDRAYQDVWIPLGRGQAQLHSWWLPAHGQDTGLTLLYLHGNSGNLSTNLGLASTFQSLGLSVLMVDYRGYGLSTGPFPSETRMYQDAIAGWHYLTETQGIPPESIVIFGHSIGGAIAIDLALQTPQAAGLIVEGSFTSMKDMAAIAGYGRWLPLDWLLTQRFDSLQKVPSLELPVLFIHGLADQSVPADMSRRLYQAAPQPKSLWLVPGADHNNVYEVANPEYGSRILQFLQMVAGVQPSSGG